MVTRVATVASVALLAVAGVVGVALSLAEVDSDDPAPMILDPPSPAVTDGPVDHGACDPAPYRPTYLPWAVEEGPLHVEPGQPQPEARDARSLWSADPSAFDPDTGRTRNAPTVELTTFHDPDLDPTAVGDDGRRVPVDSHTATMIWVGDPGEGDVGLLWREEEGPCGVYGLWLSSAGIGAYLEDHDDPVDAAAVDAIEDELVQISQSLVAWEREDVAFDDAAEHCGDVVEDTEPGPGSVAVYLYCEGTMPGPVAVTRAVPDDATPIETATEALADGPTDEERDQGFYSTLAELGDVVVVDARIDEEGSRAVVDLANLPDELTPEQRSFLPPGFLEQIAFTVFHLDDAIQEIELRRDGSCDAFWDLLTGEDCRPYTRDDWGHVEGG